MASDLGGNCARIFLIIFNIIFLAVGGALLGIGIWFTVEDDAFEFDDFRTVVTSVVGADNFEIGFYVFIGIGAFIFLFAIFGLVATVLESPLFLVIYIVIIVVLFVAQVVLGVLIILYRDDIFDRVDERLTGLTKMKYYTNDSPPKATDSGKSLDIIQTKFKCCGINGYTDYTQGNFTALHGMDVPYSCCVLKPNKNWEDATQIANVAYPEYCAMRNTTAFYTTSCKQAAEDWVNEWAYVLVGAALGVAAFEIFGFIFAVCLCTAVRREL